jgi:threonyl-tRNA synthetase
VIEKRMREIVQRDEKISREVWDREEAIKHFRDIGEAYKAEIIEDIPGGDTITVYRQGAWKDLCRGPHLPSTRHIGQGFKLTKLAGAYWRGDQRNAQLQRIYGTAWARKRARGWCSGTPRAGRCTAPCRITSVVGSSPAAMTR